MENHSTVSAWHDEQVSSAHEAHEAHKNRLEKIGYHKIANKINSIANQLRYFEKDNPNLPHVSWVRLNEIKRLVEVLK